MTTIKAFTRKCARGGIIAYSGYVVVRDGDATWQRHFPVWRLTREDALEDARIIQEELYKELL